MGGYYGSMRNYLKIILASLTVFITALTVSVQTTNSQTVNDNATTSVKVITVATVNIYDATSTQKDNVFSVSFDLTNGAGVQPGVMYSVFLLKEVEGSQVLVDEHVYSEIINLGENSSVHKVITYIAPVNLEGKYKLFLSSKNSNGFPFGLASLGNVTLTKGTKNNNVTNIFIDTTSCYLTILNEKNQPHYNPIQGVDVDKSETLISNCIVENTGISSVDIIPTFVTRARSNFGDVVDAERNETKSVTLPPGEKVAVSSVIPKGITPQSYNVAVSYESSNKVFYHYVLRGGSGTIQNLFLDKDNYAKGEIVNISFMWSGSADNFSDSRSGTSTTLMSPTFSLSLFDELGNRCAEPHAQYIAEGDILVKTTIILKKACVHPRVTVVLADTKFGVLAQSSFETATTSPIKDKASMLSGMMSLVVVILTVVILLLLKNNSNIFVSKIKIFFFFLVVSSYLSGVDMVKASTFVVPGQFGGNWTFVVNPNKTSFSPGEVMTISGSYSASTCGNAVQSDIDYTVNGSSGNILSHIGHDYAGAANVAVQSTAGAYTADITATVMGFSPFFIRMGGTSFGYTVVAPPTPPTVNLYFSFLNSLRTGASKTLSTAVDYFSVKTVFAGK